MNVGVDKCIVVASSGDEIPSYAESVDGNLEPPRKKVLTETWSLASNFQDLIKTFQKLRVER